MADYSCRLNTNLATSEMDITSFIFERNDLSLQVFIVIITSNNSIANDCWFEEIDLIKRNVWKGLFVLCLDLRIIIRVFYQYTVAVLSSLLTSMTVHSFLGLSSMTSTRQPGTSHDSWASTNERLIEEHTEYFIIIVVLLVISILRGIRIVLIITSIRCIEIVCISWLTRCIWIEARSGGLRRCQCWRLRWICIV